MHDVACEFARAVVRSKDAQKQLARTSLNTFKIVFGLVRTIEMGQNLNLAAKVEKSIFLSFFWSTNSTFCLELKRNIVFLKRLKSPCIIGLIPVFDYTCIQLARGKFELAKRDSAGGKKIHCPHVNVS